MPKGVLVDTSFLISLVASGRKNHLVARDYFRAAIEQGVPLFLSTLVACEFSRKQPVEDLGLHNFLVLPFNLPEAVQAAKLSAALKRDDGDDRTSVAIDVMLLAQADKNQIGAILTEDADTLGKYCDRLRQQGLVTCHAIVLSDGFAPARLTDAAVQGLTFPPVEEA